MRDRKAVYLWALALAATCAFAISSTSFWIDEFDTWALAAIPAFSDFMTEFTYWPVSDIYMPVYMTYLWGWVRLLGDSEVAMRLANAPLFIGAGIGFYWLLKRSSLPAGWIMLMLVVSPFAVYYLNEARPYAMQLSGALLACGFMGAVFWPAEGKGEVAPNAWAWWLFAIGCLLVGGSNMLGAPWIGAALLALAWLWWRGRLRLTREALIPLVVMGGALAVIGLWDLRGLLRGAHQSQISGAGWMEWGFTLYELNGFLGLGPGRLALRSDGLDAFRENWLLCALLAALTGAVMGGFIVALRKRRLDAVNLAGMAMVLGFPILFMIVVGELSEFRVLGRHLATMAPVFYVLLGCGLHWAWGHGGRAMRACSVGVVLLLGWSSLSLRFDPRHQKDDYRGAVEVMHRVTGPDDVLWWQAAPLAVPLLLPEFIDEGTGEPLPRLRVRMTRGRYDAARDPVPDVIVLSRPDIYDRDGLIGELIRAEGFTKVDEVSAFTIWVRQRGPTQGKESGVTSGRESGG